MTSVERLITQIVGPRIRQAEYNAKYNKRSNAPGTEPVPVTKLPKHVRKVLANLLATQKQVARLKKELERCGFAAPYERCGAQPTTLSRDRAYTAPLEAKHEAAQKTLIRDLYALKDQAILDTIGKTPAQAKDYLDKLAAKVQAL